MTLGIDIGTTSVSGVAVDGDGAVAATVTQAHAADIPGLPPGVHAQDPARLMSAVDRVIAALEAQAGAADRIGWTGQMHGVVGVDRDLRPVTPFVTWRDARRFGGRVMAGWAAENRPIAACLPICGLAIARRTGRRVIDPTFLHSWHLEEVAGKIPPSWLPDVDESSMLGDNQAGVYAARHLYPGCAVMNLGTSGQSSVEYALVLLAFASVLGAFACIWHAGRRGALLERATEAASHQLGGGDPLGSARDLSLF